ncbi:hypothetical protein [Arenibaculum pallidiluteum]|uniref:hypothetical protein n=1 Tax=Arenibaculum pallidiluteum TaxID=2812559 RepID=UPI001A97B081|nr:hypothetical protein [Arenibaculum pallidiluteum]
MTGAASAAFRDDAPPLRLAGGTAIACVPVLALLRVDAGTGHLWLDEIFGATYVAQGFGDALIGALRFDLHPPAWYAQLNLWPLSASAIAG